MAATCINAYLHCEPQVRFIAHATDDVIRAIYIVILSSYL